MEVKSREWEGELTLRAADLLREANEAHAMTHYKRIRALKSPSAKLIYIFTWHHQPQSFTSIRRTLGLGKSTVFRGLRENIGAGLIVRDTQYLYWITTEGPGKRGEQ